MASHDVIIIGTGAGGGTLARHLAPSGKRVLLLERGDWLTREPANWDTAAVFIDNRYVSPDSWHDSHGATFAPQVHYFVGGATKLYGAALYRLRKEDFGELRHHDGISPAWPISYEELEPYYTLAEQRYEVHGDHGEDPTDPPASAQYPFPAVSHEPRIQQLHDQLEGLGYHPFHAPCGVRLNEGNPPYCSACGARRATGSRVWCTPSPTPRCWACDPRSSTPTSSLITNTRVVRLETDPSGRTVTEVVVDRDGAEERFSAPIVVVACGAANTAKLLLQSANDKHPAALQTAATRWAATTCSTPARQCWRCPATRIRRCSRRRLG